ncbi:MAG: UbiD family decarboxylase [Chloroflexi bacterium]|nr:UbiD family decarboxylase [Chloroflexota bacterium]
MSYKDLREFLEQVDKIGELTRLDGVDWDLEVGEVARVAPNTVLMDNFPGYPPGYRVVVKMGGSQSQFFLATNWSTDARGLELTKAWKDRLKEFKPISPRWVTDGPIMENVSTGEDINLLKFPVPKWHDADGGRYIGTQDMIILRDPETGRINCGTYRMQLYDKNTVALYMSEGKDGNMIREKYFRQGKPCPVVAVFGMDPALTMCALSRITHEDGKSELDFAGWLKGMPEEVIRGQFTGLPIPANAEIAIEGEITAGDTRMEGPFGEAGGYSEPRALPVVRVKTLYHRNAPIITGTAPLYSPPGRGELHQDFFRATALIWDQLEKAGVREIKGVSCYYGNRLTVISIRNCYAGHSRQAGLIASACHTGSYQGSWVIVVDDDIDPTCLNDVLWAVLTRADPKRAIQVLDYLWSSHMSLIDPSRPFIKAEYPLMPEKATYRSGVVVDACIPVEWDHSWHRIITHTQELEDRVRDKYGQTLFMKGSRQPVSARSSRESGITKQIGGADLS